MKSYKTGERNYRLPYSTSGIRQYLLVIAVVIIVSAGCFFVEKHIGYQSVSLIFLFTVSLLAIFMGIGPITLAAGLSAVIWNFFFIPPRFTINIEDPEDTLMFAMFFIIALVNGILTSRIRKEQKLAEDREEKANALYELARKARFLDESGKLYKTLFNSISHELRIPVSTILSASESMLSGNHPESIKAELLNTIMKASSRLNRLIENLLNMSRIESGHIEPRPDWCDIQDVINKVVTSLEDELQNFTLKVNIAPDVPPIKVDFGLLEQTIYNLLFNATQYASQSPDLAINVSYSDRSLVIEIMDRGPGFSDEDIPLIFNKFYRVKGTAAGGTGLGLSIAKGFTEAMKGKISAGNREGGGARFIIEIPSDKPDVEIQ